MKHFGTWNPVPSREDRLGRVTGALWVVRWAICVAYSFRPLA